MEPVEGLIGVDGGELVSGTGTADFEMVTLGTAVLTLNEPEEKNKIK